MLKLIGFPSASVPFEVFVIVLPSLLMTVLPVVWYFPPVFFVSLVNVFASICFIESVSNWVPVPLTGAGVPSYLTVYVVSAGVPSVLSPLLVTLTPPSTASRTVIWLLYGFCGVGLYLVFSVLRFQVPIELSAANMLMAVVAMMTTAVEKLSRIRSPYRTLPGTHQGRRSLGQLRWRNAITLRSRLSKWL